MLEKPLVSIITVCFNSEKTIEDTIKSVISQNYDNIEYLIIDGLSTDNTLDIVRKYNEKSDIKFNIISEKDDGLYDAMNKGIKLCNGEIIAIINSDDFYTDENVISDVVKQFKTDNAEIVYGNLNFVDEQDKYKIVRKWIAKSGKFNQGWNPPHPTTFVKKSVYDKFGVFETKFKIAADYDILYRFIEKYKVKTSYINRYLVDMRMGGESTKSIKNIIKGNREIAQSLKENGAKNNNLIVFKRLIKKVNQFV